MRSTQGAFARGTDKKRERKREMGRENEKQRGRPAREKRGKRERESGRRAGGQEERQRFRDKRCIQRRKGEGERLLFGR